MEKRQMSREQATESKEVHDVLVARWRGFQTLAKTLPNHHILAVELIRTLEDTTIAVFTVVKDGTPIRYVVTGDSRGRVKANPGHCASPDKAEADFGTKLVPDVADPAVIALGIPPPQQPSTPGVVAVGGGLLAAAFDVGERVDISPK